MFLSEILIRPCMFIHCIAENTSCLVRYLNPASHRATSIAKADKDFEKRYDFKDIKFPVKN